MASELELTYGTFFAAHQLKEHRFATSDKTTCITDSLQCCLTVKIAAGCNAVCKDVHFVALAQQIERRLLHTDVCLN